MKNTERTEIRKNEILDQAEKLFLEKGYEQTTINDILQVSGAAKGSLYYHYKSKADVLDGIIKRRGDENIARARQIATTPGVDARTKLLQVIFSQQPQDEHKREITKELERSGDGQMFLKSLTDIQKRLAPVLSEIVEEGIAQKVFTVTYPLQSVEILLSAAHCLFDNPLALHDPLEQRQKMLAFITVTEKVLGAQSGSLAQLAQIYPEQSK